MGIVFLARSVNGAMGGMLMSEKHQLRGARQKALHGKSLCEGIELSKSVEIRERLMVKRIENNPLRVGGHRRWPLPRPLLHRVLETCGLALVIWRKMIEAVEKVFVVVIESPKHPSTACNLHTTILRKGAGLRSAGQPTQSTG